MLFCLQLTCSLKRYANLGPTVAIYKSGSYSLFSDKKFNLRLTGLSASSKNSARLDQISSND